MSIFHDVPTYNTLNIFVLSVLLDTELMYRTGGIRVLIQAISDGPPELGPLFVTAFLFIVDAPRTRAYLRPDVDLEVRR